MSPNGWFWFLTSWFSPSPLFEMELGGKESWGRLTWGNEAAHWMLSFSSVRLSKRWAPFGSEWVWEGHTHSHMHPFVKLRYLVACWWWRCCWYCSPAVGWCSGEALSFQLSTYQQENSLILLPFVQHIRGRKGQAGRTGREMEHDKVSTDFWSLFLHTNSLLLPAGVCCAAGTWA